MRTDQVDIHLKTVAGRDLGLWTGASGGDVDSSEAMVRDKAGQGTRQLGGPRFYTNMTLTKNLVLPGDLVLLRYLESAAGSTRLNASEVALDGDYNVVDTLRTRTGIIKSPTISDRKIEADGSESMTLSCELSLDGP